MNHSTVCEYLKNPGWGFPQASRHTSSKLWRVFDSHRSSGGEHEKIRASSSELLGLYGLLRHFVETQVPAES